MDDFDFGLGHSNVFLLNSFAPYFGQQSSVTSFMKKDERTFFFEKKNIFDDFFHVRLQSNLSVAALHRKTHKGGPGSKRGGSLPLRPQVRNNWD